MRNEKILLGGYFGLLALFFLPIVSAITIDANVSVQTQVPATLTFTQKITGTNNQAVYYTKDNNTLATCSGNAVIWDSNATGDLNFLVTDINEFAVDFRLQVGANEHDLNLAGTQIIPVFTGDDVCIKGILKRSGTSKLITSDNIIVQ